MSIPESITVGVGNPSEPFSCDIIDEEFINTLRVWDWELSIEDSSIATYAIKTFANVLPFKFVVTGLKTGETKLNICFTYNKKNNLNSELTKFTVPVFVR